MSGFCGENVGLLVGFLSLPDKDWPWRLNSLDAKCWKCRVFTAVESSGEFGPVLRVELS